MKAKETLEEFYVLHGKEHDQDAQCSVYRREDFECSKSLKPVYRRDFYKISMVCEGTGILSYADKFIRIDKPTLLFLNPLIPYSWEPSSPIQTGYFCLFTEEFVSPELKNEGLSQSVLFKAGGDHVFFPDEAGTQLLKNIYENMLNEARSDYGNKYSLLRNYIQIIMHEALKMQPPETYGMHSNASERISALFFDLLEKQFPVDPVHHIMALKNANEFASQLNIHTNHLNKSLKETTDKTTSEWITERIMKEAKSLLQFSNWSIGEIAHCLGFEHASNFIISFKRRTGDSPNQFRKKILSKS